LIDSVIKNIPESNYLQLFTKNIVNSFVLIFEQVIFSFNIYDLAEYCIIKQPVSIQMLRNLVTGLKAVPERTGTPYRHFLERRNAIPELLETLEAER